MWIFQVWLFDHWDIMFKRWIIKSFLVGNSALQYLFISGPSFLLGIVEKEAKLRVSAKVTCCAEPQCKGEENRVILMQAHMFLHTIVYHCCSLNYYYHFHSYYALSFSCARCGVCVFSWTSADDHACLMIDACVFCHLFSLLFQMNVFCVHSQSLCHHFCQHLGRVWKEKTLLATDWHILFNQ